MKRRCGPTKTPTRLSFLHAIRAVRRKLLIFSAIPPRDRPALHSAVLDEILQERLSARAHRRNKRGVKRNMSSFPMRRRKADRPSPPVDFAKAIQILQPDSLRAQYKAC
jgi:hypothetical protein